jgi:hypothetical protein
MTDFTSLGSSEWSFAGGRALFPDAVVVDDPFAVLDDDTDPRGAVRREGEQNGQGQKGLRAGHEFWNGLVNRCAPIIFQRSTARRK